MFLPASVPNPSWAFMGCAFAFCGHPFPAGDYEKAAQIKKDTDKMFLKHLSDISNMSSIETFKIIQGSHLAHQIGCAPFPYKSCRNVLGLV